MTKSTLQTQTVQKINPEAERAKIGQALKKWVDETGLRGKKIKIPTQKQKDEWTKAYLARTQGE